MGAQEPLTVAADRATPALAPAEGRAGAGQPVPRSAFVAAGLVGVASVVWTTRGFFLFNDDYLFLGEADRTPFGLDYLRLGLFQHFSPVSRVLDAAFVGVLPDHSWTARALMVGLYAGYAGSAVLLAVVLLGRTRVALLTSVSLATSLAVLSLASWWTAALNILPSLAGSALCLTGAAALARGRSAWWGVLSLAGYTLGVLDYETAMLVPAYALAWVLLLPGDGGRPPLRVLWHRTGWLWLALGGVGAAALVNYRLNYYTDTPAASLGAYAEAFARSLFEVQLPLILGFSDLDNRIFTWCGIVLAAGAVVALVIRAVRRPAMWRGLGFAAAGWLLPIAALVLNRVGVVGQTAVRLPYYFGLSTMLVVLGVAAALSVDGPQAVPPRRARGRMPAAVPVLLALVAVAAWAHSLDPSSGAAWRAGHQLYPDEPVNTDRFVTELRASAQEVAERDPSATLLDAVVPDSVVWPQYVPYNRLGVVARLVGVELPVDDPAGSPYVATSDGRLVPAELVWQQRLTLHRGDEPGLTLSSVSGLAGSGGGACFETAKGAAVEWLLPAPVRGDHLVVRAQVTVDRATPYVVYTAAGGSDYGFANNAGKSWDTSRDTWLDPVDAHRVDKLVITGVDAGVRVCLSSLSVGEAVTR